MPDKPMINMDDLDPKSGHGRTDRRCRYECGDAVTHFCKECSDGASGLSGYFCEFHAARHNAIVASKGGTVFAERLKGT